jgi:carbon-monoxide dehydrogenase small subunit
MKVAVDVNGTRQEHDVEPRVLLVHYLREVVGLTGTNVGCDTSSCGACTLLMGGESVKSCTVLAVQADGGEVLTVEGLASEGKLHPVQQAFGESYGLQCGYCTPGLLISTYQLLQKKSDPSEKDIRKAIAGNTCRCTGYMNVFKAIRMAAKLSKEG